MSRRNNMVQRNLKAAPKAPRSSDAPRLDPPRTSKDGVAWPENPQLIEELYDEEITASGRLTRRSIPVG